jgi:hypothetical protein
MPLYNAQDPVPIFNTQFSSVVVIAVAAVNYKMVPDSHPIFGPILLT